MLLLFYLGTVAFSFFIIWQIVFSLRRISKGVEDIAETLRRIEARGPRTNPSAQTSDEECLGSPFSKAPLPSILLLRSLLTGADWRC